MPYLLNLLYVGAAGCSPRPGCSLPRFARASIAQGWGEKFLGLVPRRDSLAPLRLAARRERGRSQPDRPLVGRDSPPASRLGIVISTTTLTGYALATNALCRARRLLLPAGFQLGGAARRCGAFGPTLLVLAELELWPNLIAAAAPRGAQGGDRQRPAERSQLSRLPPASAAGRAGCWRKVDLIAAQNAHLCRAVSGHRRAERRACTSPARSSSTVPRPIATIPPRCACASWPAFAPTTWSFWPAARRSPKSDWPWMRSASWRRRIRDLRLVIVPRHPERLTKWPQLLAASGLAWQRRSQLGHRRRRSRRPACCLVDRVGELGAWWGTAQIAYVGGSMGKRGGQNMIEPAAYGAAVSFGPNTRNFRDIVAALLAGEAAVVVHDGAELTAFVRRCLEDPQFAEQLGSRARRVVAVATRRHARAPSICSMR